MNRAEQAAMREPNATHFFYVRTGLKPLRHKGIIKSGMHAARWKMDPATLKEQAERCRRLAKHADPFTRKRLLDLAAEYEARLAQFEPKASAATRSLRNGET